MERLLEAEKLLSLIHCQLLHRDLRPVRNRPGDVIARHQHVLFLRLFPALLLSAFKASVQSADLFMDLMRFLKRA